MKIKIALLLCVFFIISFLLSSAKASILNDIDKNKKYVYKNHIFVVANIIGNENNEIIIATSGRNNISILRWNGLWFKKISKIEVPFTKVNDIAVGDVDNDGNLEMAILSGKELYICKKRNGQFVIDPQKTTPLYGEKRYGKKEVLEATDKFIDWQISETRGSDEGEVGRLDSTLLEGKLVRIGDVNNDRKNEVVITKQNAYLFGDTGYAYTIDILKWQDKHFEVAYSYPAAQPYMGYLGGDGPGDAGIVIDDLNSDGKNELIFAGEDGFTILEYALNYYTLYGQELKDIFLIKASCDINLEEVHGQHINIGMLNGKKVLVYSGFGKHMEDWINNKWAHNGVVEIIYLGKDTFPYLGRLPDFKSQKSFSEEEWKQICINPIGDPEAFAPGGRLAPRHVTERFEGIKGFVIGNLDKDQENELIVNTAAGAYIYGLKFNIALIISIIAGAILIIALAIFLLIRTTRKKKTVPT